MTSAAMGCTAGARQTAMTAVRVEELLGRLFEDKREARERAE